MKPQEAYRRCMRNLLKVEIALYILQAVLLLGFPDPAPIHWNGEGIADSYASKWVYLLYDLIPFIVIWLFYIPLKMPVTPAYVNTRAWRIFSLLFCGMMMGVAWIPNYMFLPSVQTPQRKVQLINGVVLLCLGIIFLLLGNFLPQVPPNHHFGAKTPWTKGDSANWKKTNHLCSILLFGAGALFVLAALFNSSWSRNAGKVTVVITIVTYLYSFYQSRRRK